MHFSITTIGILLSFSILSACSPKPPEATIVPLVNPGFELSPAIPKGWSFSQHAGVLAYERAIDTKQFGEGKQSFRVKRTQQQHWGMLTQYLPFTGNDGKILTVSAMVKGEKLGKDGFELAVNFRKKNHKFISNMKSKPLTGDSEWHKISFSAPIPQQTAKIQISAILLDSGTAWLDNIKITLKESSKH